MSDMKSEAKCSKCGFSHPAALHYHHDKGNKKARVAALVAKSSSMKGVLAEIAKCVVLCANCHAIEHYNERRGILS